MLTLRIVPDHIPSDRLKAINELLADVHVISANQAYSRPHIAFEVNSAPVSSASSACIGRILWYNDEPTVPIWVQAELLAKGNIGVGYGTADEEVANITRHRLQGSLVIPFGIASSIARGETTLLPSERQVLGELSSDHTFFEISQRLHYSERHVARILRSLRAKSGLHDRHDIVKHFSNVATGQTSSAIAEGG